MLCVVLAVEVAPMMDLPPPFLQQNAIPITLRCKPCITRQGRHSVDPCFHSPGSSGHFFKVKIMSQTVVNVQKQSPAEEIRRENLYHTKLQCLAEVLGRQSFVDKNDAERSAEAINAAFDKITF